MDRFTRNYARGLAVVTLLVPFWWAVKSCDPRVAALDALLRDDADLADYPYRFRVLDYDAGVVTLGSPRSAELPVLRILPVLDPSLAGLPQDHPRMMAAQAELARHQQRAQALVLARPGVREVRWELDRAWYRRRGIDPESLMH